MATTPKKNGGGPEFTKWFRPLIECLHELGAVRPREAADWIAEKEAVPLKIRELVNKNGGERFLNQVCFARQYLLWEGLIDGSKHGVWSLTAKGLHTHLTDDSARNIAAKWGKFWAKARKGSESSAPTMPENPRESEVDPSLEAEEMKENAILNILLNLSPKGFEHFCRHLLLAYNFENVKVTGQSHDGGIDGEGVLQINPFVSSKVVFQCKRYKKSVSREEVARLRGDADGRADKAMLITTGTFSAPAKAEAVRKTPHIELIDGEQLIAMCEAKQLGLKPRMVFDIDHEFFKQFA